MGEHKVNGGLGFRELECYNLALIAKQLWRFLTHPQSLVATIFKEKYCKNENIMSIKAKGHKSLVWKSILAARDLIERGLRWRVGDGKKIKIWEDRWLPSRGSFKIQSPNKILPRSAIVKDLIQDADPVWKVELINLIFWEEEAKIILGIPLVSAHLEDKMIWALIKNGVFTVKSAYYNAMN